MPFFGLPCDCGWSLDELEVGRLRVCARCGRRWEWAGSYWSQVTPRHEIRTVLTCCHNRLAGEPCPHCPGGIAAEHRRDGMPIHLL